MKIKKTQQKVDSIFNSLAVLSALVVNDRLAYNGYPVDEYVRRDAIMYELNQLAHKTGFTDKMMEQMADDLDWSETSPEQIEFNNALTDAMQKFLISAGESDDQKTD